MFFPPVYMCWLHSLAGGKLSLHLEVIATQNAQNYEGRLDSDYGCCLKKVFCCVVMHICYHENACCVIILSNQMFLFVVGFVLELLSPEGASWLGRTAGSVPAGILGEKFLVCL